MSIVIPVSTLVDYTGGPLVSLTYNPNGGDASNYAALVDPGLSSGALAAVPEPSTFGLAGMATLVGLGVWSRRRRLAAGTAVPGM